MQYVTCSMQRCNLGLQLPGALDAIRGCARGQTQQEVFLQLKGEHKMVVQRAAWAPEAPEVARRNARSCLYRLVMLAAVPLRAVANHDNCWSPPIYTNLKALKI